MTITVDAGFDVRQPAIEMIIPTAWRSRVSPADIGGLFAFADIDA